MPTPQIIKSGCGYVVQSWTDGIIKMHNIIYNTHEILQIAKEDYNTAFDLAMDKGDEVLAQLIIDRYVDNKKLKGDGCQCKE